MHTEEVAQASLSDYETERGKPTPSKHHAILQSNLLFGIRLKYDKRWSVLSEVALQMGDQYRTPDLAIYPKMPWGQEEMRMTQMPVGVVEILSPSQTLDDLAQKRQSYFDAGVQSYWLVLPDLQSVYVFQNTEEYEVFTHRDVLKDRVLDIELDLREMFA